MCEGRTNSDQDRELQRDTCTRAKPHTTINLALIVYRYESTYPRVELKIDHGHVHLYCRNADQ